MSMLPAFELAAVPLADTLKRATPQGMIAATIERAGLWRAQTPQGFLFAAILKAHRDAAASGRSDFTDDAVFRQLLDNLDGNQPDLIVSDIAPNISGVAASDQASSMYLVELTLDMVRQVLKPGGNYVVKVFQGEGSDQFLKDVRSSFEKVVIRKPEASRPRSREVYFVAKGFKA